MSTREIKTRLSIDGEKQYKDSIANINAALKSMNSEMAAVTAKYKGNEDSIEALSAQSDVLNKKYAEQLKKLEEMEKAHKNAAKQVGDEDKRTRSWAESVNYAKARLADMERQMEEVRRKADPLVRAIAENEKAAQDAANRVGYLSSEMRALDAQYANNTDSAEYLAKRQEILDRQYRESVQRVEAYEKALRDVAQQSGKNSDEYRQMESSLNNARAEMYNAGNAADGLERGSRGLGGTISDLAGKFGIQLPSGVSEALGSLDAMKSTSGKTGNAVSGDIGNMTGGFGGMVGVIGGVTMALGSIAEKAIETSWTVKEQALDMQVSLGLTAEEAKKAADVLADVFYTGITGDRGAAQEATTVVMRVFNETGTRAEELALKLLAINRGWGEGFSETARAAWTMMQTFGITSDEALDKIAYGLDTSANNAGDLLDVINEFSPQFKRWGDDADKMIARIKASTDAGAWSADKTSDAMKELWVRAVDANDDYIQALESLGLTSESTINDILSEGESAADAFTLIMEKVASVTDKAERSKIAEKLFGTQWEDATLGPLLAMADVEGKIADITGNATEAVNTYTENSQTKLRGFWNAFNEYMLKALNFIDLLDLLAGTVDSISAGINETNSLNSATASSAQIQKSLNEVAHQTSSRSTYNGLSGGGDTYIDKVQIDASSVKEFNDVVDILKNARQIQRSGGS